MRLYIFTALLLLNLLCSSHTVRIVDHYNSSGLKPTKIRITETSGDIPTALNEEALIYCKTNTELKYCTFMTPDQETFTMSNDPRLQYQGGRLHYPEISQPEQTCGINITRVVSRDFGQWRCQVVGMIGGKMSTATADITVREGTGVKMQVITSEKERIRPDEL